MTCRHKSFDPSCSSYKASIDQLKDDYEREILDKIKAESPDMDNFSIEDIEQVGTYLVVKAKYPTCKKCEYEGHKVMIFSNTTIKDAIKWRQLDPHFRGPTRQDSSKAPSPVARFPGDPAGWDAAKRYASWLISVRDRSLGLLR